jgi:hypothetical protein
MFDENIFGLPPIDYMIIHGFKAHEIYFAQHLGVELDEDCSLQLVAVAKAALYDLPNGWTTGVYENEDDNVDLYFFNLIKLLQ